MVGGSFGEPCARLQGQRGPVIRAGSGGADAWDLSRGVWLPVLSASVRVAGQTPSCNTLSEPAFWLKSNFGSNWHCNSQIL